MIKRTLAMGLLALALNVPVHAAQEAGVDAAPLTPAASVGEAADAATGRAEGHAAPPALAAPSRPENLAYGLIALGLLVGLLARRRR